MHRHFNSYMLAVCILSALDGCTAVPRNEALADQCDFRADQRFASLAGKVPLSAKDRNQPPSAAELANTSKPTTQERQVLIALDQEFQPCRTQALSVADSSDANAANMLRQAYAAYSSVDAKLISGEWTYAQWRQQRYDLYLTVQKAMLEREQAKREANAARMRRASAILGALGAGQPIPP